MSENKVSKEKLSKQLILATRLINVEKIYDPVNNTTKKVVIFDKNPDFHFYVTKKGQELDIYQTAVPMDMVERVDCKYNDRFKVIAERTGKMKYYNKYAGNYGGYSKLRRLNFNKDVHGSDFDIVDYKMRKFSDENQYNKIELPLHKLYFDIEVDTYHYDGGFPEEEEAPCPVDFISLVDDKTHKLKLYILLASDNPSQKEFIKRNKVHNKRVWTDKDTPWVEKAMKEHFQSGNPKTDIQEMEIEFFTKELPLIVKFLREVNATKFDVIGAYNAHFDIVTLQNRLALHYGLDPADYFCPEEFPDEYKRMNVIKDTFSGSMEDISHTFDIESYGHWVDLQSAYLSIRKGSGKKDSTKLQDILMLELGEGKFEYESDNISEASRKDFESFLLYSAYDSYRLSQLENKNNDIDLLYKMSSLMHTRFSKVMRKTVSIRNFIAEFFYNNGLIISNNQNYFIEHENIGKFQGALTI